MTPSATPMMKSCSIRSMRINFPARLVTLLPIPVVTAATFPSAKAAAIRIFKTSATYMTFFIGHNTRQSDERPYEYVPVRHIPLDPENYAYYGEDLLPNFDLLPTWAYSTPHNIQRNTPQNQSCNSCHGNADIFLTADKVRPEELEANKDVIVENVPAPIPGQ